jgi:hypothetical protein
MQLLALALAAAAAAFGGTPAQAAVHAGGLRLERPAGRVLVELAPPEHGAREGSFTLLLRNTAAVALQPRVTLDPEGVLPVLRLHLFSRAKGAVWIRSAGRVPRIQPHGVGRVAVLVRLPAGGVPSGLDGTLVIRPIDAKRKPVRRATTIPFAATGLRLTDVEPVPGTIVLNPTGALPGGRLASGTEAAFELRGLDASTLLGSGLIGRRALLRSSDGHTISVDVVTTRSGGELRPVVKLIGRAEAGTYTGSIPLSGGSETPAISVTVKARDAIYWALAAVVLGTLLGGLLPLLGKRARRRNILRARLQGILLEYFSADSVDSEMRWLDLSAKIGSDRVPWTSTEWFAEPSLHGAAGLFSELRWAQSESDLNEAGEAIEELIAQIARWLLFQAKVSLLAQLADSEAKMPEIEGRKWSESATMRESEALRQSVILAPPPEEAVAAKLKLLAEQAYWHAELASEWKLLAEAWDKLGPIRSIQLVQGMLTAPSPASQAETSPASLTALYEELGRLRKRVDLAVSPLGGKAPGRREQALTETTPRLGLKLRFATWLAGLWPRFQTWATRALLRAQPARIMAAVRRQDLMLSTIAALGAALVYVLQIYTSSWGSLIDYLSAIAAGFGAQVIVRWAALPIFESLGKNGDGHDSRQGG